MRGGIINSPLCVLCSFVAKSQSHVGEGFRTPRPRSGGSARSACRRLRGCRARARWQRHRRPSGSHHCRERGRGRDARARARVPSEWGECGVEAEDRLDPEIAVLDRVVVVLEQDRAVLALLGAGAAGGRGDLGVIDGLDPVLDDGDPGLLDESCSLGFGGSNAVSVARIIPTTSTSVRWLSRDSFWSWRNAPSFSRSTFFMATDRRGRAAEAWPPMPRATLRPVGRRCGRRSSGRSSGWPRRSGRRRGRVRDGG